LHLRNGIVFIEGFNKGRFPFSNSLLVKGRDKTVLIDVGAGLNVLSGIKDRVDIVVITHLHPDHFALSYLFRGKNVYVPMIEAKYKRLVDLASRYVGKKLVDTWINFVKTAMNAKDPYFTDVYEEGDVIELGGVEIHPIYTPGHTVGHYVMLIGDNIVHGADIDLTSFGPWYGHVESNIEDFTKSIKRVMELEPEIYVSGHKPPIQGTEKIRMELEKYVKKFDETSMKILEILKEPRSLEDLTKMGLIYPKKPYQPKLLEYWEKNMILHHLKLMVKRRLIKKLKDEKYVSIEHFDRNNVILNMK